MPTYEYVCEACHHEFERFHSMSQAPIKKCPTCGKLKVQRKISLGGGIIFKGGGFYETDYRGDAYQKSKDADKPADVKAEAKADAKPDPKGDAKPAETSAAKPDAPPKPDASPKPEPAAPKVEAPKPEPKASKSAAKQKR